MCLSVSDVHVSTGTCRGPEKGVRSLKVQVTGSYEPPNMGAENQNPIFCKSNIYF